MTDDERTLLMMIFVTVLLSAVLPWLMEGML